ncbi:hypothetical protein OPV22_029840 [Ensete ventricosum]|uniref:Uncharacterized protein n=1 Tax=Ensete ventricosum TaxID=4639 RepID=A0AAV8Q2G1_ENSVE|nr:hypothetical protein OPV22_029840 [Ensete ventricosum]
MSGSAIRVDMNRMRVAPTVKTPTRSRERSRFSWLQEAALPPSLPHFFCCVVAADRIARCLAATAFPAEEVTSTPEAYWLIIGY